MVTGDRHYVSKIMCHTKRRSQTIKRVVRSSAPFYVASQKVDSVVRDDRVRNSTYSLGVSSILSFVIMMRVLNIAGYASLLVAGTTAFTTPSSSSQLSVTSLNLFDKFQGWGSASKDDLDEQWEAQQEILRNRRKPQEQRDKYFEEVKKRRLEASKKQDEMWSWQTKSYKKGEDPIDEWKKRRASGQISDLDDQYGKPEEKGVFHYLWLVLVLAENSV